MAPAMTGKNIEERNPALSTSKVTVIAVSPFADGATSTVVVPLISEFWMFHPRRRPSILSRGVALPTYLFPAAMVSKENPWSLPASSIRGSKTRSTPPMASQVSGLSRAAQTTSKGTFAVERCVKVCEGTAGNITNPGDG